MTRSLKSRSLGTFIILDMIDADTELHGHAHVYLGFWIRESHKMRYKARFPATRAIDARRLVTLPLTLQVKEESFRYYSTTAMYFALKQYVGRNATRMAGVCSR